MAPTRSVNRVAWRDATPTPGSRIVVEETPVAFTYNRATLAVMLATPTDLEDFAIGFSLTEGIIRHPDQIEELTTNQLAEGVELRMWLGPDRAAEAERRRRHIAGPSGCGLCGIESLHDAMRPVPNVVSSMTFLPGEIAAALAAMPGKQHLNQATRAVHAAALWTAEGGVVALREDVGRHNALDKLAGALARQGIAADRGIVLLSSRLSVELVQKAAAIGAPVLVAVSAPTALALRVADAAGITVVGVARQDGFEVFTHAERIEMENPGHVA